MTAVLPQQKPNPGDGTYTYTSQPRAVPQRQKYRNEQAPTQAPDQDGMAPYGNIMWDRRVVRGNTYAQHTLPAAAQPDPIEIQRQQEQRRRMVARKRAKEQLRPRSPDPVEGRKHIDVQTELYLEELSDRVEEADVEIQTDAFLDRPPSPLFVPAKSGVDIDTQIYEGDLFDYDIEVKPILEVLVGKTVEQALLEVMEEEELANLRAQQRAFEELRNAELVEQQRLEEQERRHREEKERRMKQQREILKKQKETADKIAARAFAQSYLADLVPSVFGTLSDNGYFYDPVERDVEQGFMPWLMDRVCEEIEKSELGRLVLDGIIREVVAARMEAYKKSFEQQRINPQSLSYEAPQTISSEQCKSLDVEYDNYSAVKIQLTSARPGGVQFSQINELREISEASSDRLTEDNVPSSGEESPSGDREDELYNKMKAEKQLEEAAKGLEESTTKTA